MLKSIYLLIPLAPLCGALLAGLFGRQIGRIASHLVTIAGVAVSFVAALLVLQDVMQGERFNGPVYTWITSGSVTLQIGFLIDQLSALLMVVVPSVSMMVHL